MISVGGLIVPLDESKLKDDFPCPFKLTVSLPYSRTARLP
jgi:hypothetical protein